jgi:3-dehydroquinate dehydratase
MDNTIQAQSAPIGAQSQIDRNDLIRELRLLVSIYKITAKDLNLKVRKTSSRRKIKSRRQAKPQRLQS